MTICQSPRHTCAVKTAPRRHRRRLLDAEDSNMYGCRGNCHYSGIHIHEQMLRLLLESQTSKTNERGRKPDSAPIVPPPQSRRRVSESEMIGAGWPSPRFHPTGAVRSTTGSSCPSQTLQAASDLLAAAIFDLSQPQRLTLKCCVCLTDSVQPVCRTTGTPPICPDHRPGYELVFEGWVTLCGPQQQPVDTLWYRSWYPRR